MGTKGAPSPRPKPKDRPKPKLLDKYCYFELMDRSYVATDHFHEYVQSHQVIDHHEELKKEAEKVADIMYNFYQLCSQYHSRKQDRKF